MSYICPHCGGTSGKFIDVGEGTCYTDFPHVCPDKKRWTEQEKQEWRESARQRYPNIQFAPSTERIAEIFGERNRIDREKEKK